MTSFIKFILRLVFLFLIVATVNSQELPPIEKFTTEDYGAENQNWMISQAENDYIYVANTGGLLEFNGADWKTYPSPNKTDIRAVNVINGRIYIGCFKEFGYYEKDIMGKFQYRSLVQTLKEKTNDTSIDIENIWNIISHEEWILFQSQKRIYIYHAESNSFRVISSENIITKIFNINNTIYYHVTDEGLYKIEQGKPALVTDDTIIKENRIINIYDFNDQLIIQTHEAGLYVLTDSKISPWNTPVNNYIKNMSVYSSAQLHDKSFVLGTISNGIIYASKNGEIIYHINQKNGLSNNTALSVFEDRDKNIWVGLDNGINCINNESPVRVFNDANGIIGTVYVTKIFKEHLYLGTNQGLFFKKIDDEKSAFKFIKGTAGQVWSLFINDNNELFCGHHTGTYLIEEGIATLINDTPGTWNIKSIPNNKDILIQGNYSGLYVLKKEEDTWRLKNKIKGFDNSARHFEINTKNQIWISHGYNGVYKLSLNDSLTETLSVTLTPELSIGKNSSLIKYRNEIYYAYEKGVFKYDTIKNKFLYDSLTSPLIEKDKYMSGKLTTTRNGILWAYSNNNINYLTIDNLSNKPKISQIPIPSYLRKAMNGYENITLIEKDKYLVGTANGYITVNLSKINHSKEYKIGINSVRLKNISGKEIEFNINDSGLFNYKSGSINFNYSVPEYNKYLIVKYQYKLEGLINKWTDWEEKNNVSFENTSYGDYTFKVRAKIGNKLSNNISTYNFKIDKPWYLSNVALLIYLFTISLLILIIHKTYSKYYNKQNNLKQAANEQTIVRINNEKLRQDIDSKNKELAISTMSIIKKNEVLSSIKKELKNNNQELRDVSSIVKLIDKNLNDTKDWQFFEEAFNNADKHFLDKVKKAYPYLTPNDLRFCAYLRLNLSSKEIAPLLNISVRSVETKRYRIRKKMNLQHDESLVNHILGI